MTATNVVQQIAAKAVIVNEKGQVLIVREASTGANNTKVGQWTLIGGRIDPGEAFYEGLAREVTEEVGMTVEPVRPLYVGEWRPVIRDVPHHIVAIFMECKVISSTSDVVLSSEHDGYAWIDPVKRDEYSMAEPDCYVVDMLVSQK